MTPPPSSKEAIVIDPVGLLSVTKSELMSAGQGKRQMRGAPGTVPFRGTSVSPANQTPPAPVPDAS